MNKMRKITMLSMLLVIALFSVPSCAPTVSQQEYDRVSNELSAIQNQLASLQDKLAEAELLQAQNEELNKQYDAVKSEFETMQAKYEELSIEYEELNKQFEELSKQYDIIIERTAEINEEDVEQAVFKLINQERKDSGLDELMWGKYLYKKAIANSRNMATNRRLEYSDRPSGQEVYWATGHSTTDGIANATLIILKNKARYELNFLIKGFNYGAVAVYKSGEIFYITCMADYYQ